MDKLGKKIVNATLILAFIFATTGCGDNEIAKEVTNAAKKAVEGEVAKTGEEIRKKVDQVIKLGNGKGNKEDKEGSTGGEKKTSEKDSKESSDDKD